MAHPGPTDSSGGHFRDKKNRRGYHRHSSPLYQSNYATEQIRDQDRLNNDNGRLNPSLLKSRGALEDSFHSESPLRRMLREREQLIKKAVKSRQAKEQEKFKFLARVVSRAGKELVAFQCPNIDLYSENDDITQKLLAIYRLDLRKFILVGRVRVVKTTKKHIHCDIISHVEEINPHKYKSGPFYLADRPYGEAARGLTLEQFRSVLSGRIWKGLPLNVFGPIFGKADRVSSHSGSWGNESSFEYDRPCHIEAYKSTKTDSLSRKKHKRVGTSFYHFRNGYLTHWKESK